MCFTLTPSFPSGITLWLSIVGRATFHAFLMAPVPNSIVFNPKRTNASSQCLLLREPHEDITLQTVLRPKGRVILSKIVGICPSSLKILQSAPLFTQNWTSKSLQCVQGPIPSAFSASCPPHQCCFCSMNLSGTPHSSASAPAIPLAWNTTFPGSPLPAWLTPSPLSRLDQISPSQLGHPDCHRPIQYSTTSPSPKSTPKPASCFIFSFPLYVSPLNVLNKLSSPARI